ncbi:MAG: hypothetical protein J3K34DRAFT_117652 [Monoraphidium minutum]|nr:MAG: hypothetical protein J3K34DRAFT_117652 [Monoraphidium minutum]
MRWRATQRRPASRCWLVPPFHPVRPRSAREGAGESCRAGEAAPLLVPASRTRVLASREHAPWFEPHGRGVLALKQRLKPRRRRALHPSSAPLAQGLLANMNCRVGKAMPGRRPARVPQSASQQRALRPACPISPPCPPPKNPLRAAHPC